MAKTFTISMNNWLLLREQIRQHYGDSMILLSSKMRRELGFTPRRYSFFNSNTFTYNDVMCLDFWDDQLQTMFLLKYGDYFT